jgi:5-methylcytosine-specific restriction endonuclease McrA
MGKWVEPKGWKRIRRAVFAAKGRTCYWCGRPATCVDHLQAVVLGGTHTLDNLVPSCTRCNASRGATLGNQLRGRVRNWPSARRW